jgi:hypothetical protein
MKSYSVATHASRVPYIPSKKWSVFSTKTMTKKDRTGYRRYPPCIIRIQ